MNIYYLHVAIYYWFKSLYAIFEMYLRLEFSCNLVTYHKRPFGILCDPSD